MRKYKVKLCVECGKNFLPTGQCAKFCGDVCRQIVMDRKSLALRVVFRYSSLWVGQGNSAKNRGRTHPSYSTGIKGFTKFKKDACERCNSKQHLLVHHKDEDRTNNKRSNAETLCKRCHQLHHGCVDRLPKQWTVEQRNRQRVSFLKTCKKLPRRSDGTYLPAVKKSAEERREIMRARMRATWKWRKDQQSWRDRLLNLAKYTKLLLEERNRIRYRPTVAILKGN